MGGHSGQPSHHVATRTTTHGPHHVHPRTHPSSHGRQRPSGASAAGQWGAVERMAALSVLLLWGHAEPRVGRPPSPRPPHCPWRQHGIESRSRMHGWTEVWWHVELRGAAGREPPAPTCRSAATTPTAGKARHSTKAQLVVGSGVAWRTKRWPPPGLTAARSSWGAAHEVHASSHSASTSIPTSSAGTGAGKKRGAARSARSAGSGWGSEVIVEGVGGDQMVHHGGRRGRKLSEVGETRRLSCGFPCLLFLRALHL